MEIVISCAFEQFPELPPPHRAAVDAEELHFCFIFFFIHICLSYGNHPFKQLPTTLSSHNFFALFFIQISPF